MGKGSIEYLQKQVNQQGERMDEMQKDFNQCRAEVFERLEELPKFRDTLDQVKDAADKTCTAVTEMSTVWNEGKSFVRFGKRLGTIAAWWGKVLGVLALAGAAIYTLIMGHPPPPPK